MPRKRKRKLPPYVARGTSAWLYIPYKKGEKRTSYRLCGLDATELEVWAAYEKFIGKQTEGTLEWLLNKYRASTDFTSYQGKAKSAKTIKEHGRQIDLLVNYPTSKDYPFGRMELHKIEPPTIRKFLDWRADNGGRVAGNHEVAIISRAWNWARERGYIRRPNPCIGVKRNPRQRRQHYADDLNYEGWLRYIEEKNAPEFLWLVSELAYLCRMRKIECLTATKSQVTDKGFDTIRRKGSRDAITGYSPRLREVLKRCDELAKRTERGRFSQYLILTDRGHPVTESGFNSVWQRHMRRAVEQGYVKERFTTHDLKRKGATDSNQDATISTGNSESQSRTYDVSKIDAEPTR